MHPSSTPTPTTPTSTRSQMIDSIYSASFSTPPPRSIEYNNRLPSPPPLIARNGPVSHHLVPPQHQRRADVSGSDTNRSRSGNNHATARPSMMFNLEACMAQLGLGVPPTPVPANAIPTLQVDDAEMADLEEDDDDDEEVAGINSPPLLSFRFRRSDLNMNLPQLSNRNQIRRISLSPRPSPSSLSSNKH